MTPQDSPRSYSAYSPTTIPTPIRSSDALMTPNTPSGDSYMSSLGYQHGRSSVPLMNQNAYYSDTTNTSTSSYNNHGRLSAPIISPSPSNTHITPNTPAMESSTLLGLEGDVQLAFSQPSTSAISVKNLRNDLLSAADNITGAMSSLVRELNSGRC